jgi:hypothetical protein
MIFLLQVMNFTVKLEHTLMNVGLSEKIEKDWIKINPNHQYIQSV